MRPVVNTDFMDQVLGRLAEQVQEAYDFGIQGMAEMEARERKAIAERNQALKDLADLSKKYAAMLHNLGLEQNMPL